MDSLATKQRLHVYTLQGICRYSSYQTIKSQHTFFSFWFIFHIFFLIQPSKPPKHKTEDAITYSNAHIYLQQAPSATHTIDSRRAYVEKGNKMTAGHYLSSNLTPVASRQTKKSSTATYHRRTSVTKDRRQRVTPTSLAATSGGSFTDATNRYASPSCNSSPRVSLTPAVLHTNKAPDARCRM